MGKVFLMFRKYREFSLSLIYVIAAFNKDNAFGINGFGEHKEVSVFFVVMVEY